MLLTFKIRSRQLKVGDKVSFFEWDDSLRNASLDPNAKYRTGVIVEVGAHYAGYNLIIKSDDGRILDLHEAIHNVEIIKD